MELVKHQATGITYRKGTIDLHVIEHIEEDYAGLPLGPYDRVLDVGGHIGCFTWLACRAGVTDVWAFEPHPMNAAIFRINHGKDEAVKLHEAALVRRDPCPGELELWLGLTGKDGTENTGGHTIEKRRGRTTAVRVKCWSIVDVLSSFEPTVIKMDCEGAEFELLGEHRLPDQVRGVCMEIHMTSKPKREAAVQMVRSLQRQGFRTVKKPALRKFWPFTTGVWSRT